MDIVTIYWILFLIGLGFAGGGLIGTCLNLPPMEWWEI